MITCGYNPSYGLSDIKYMIISINPDVLIYKFVFIYNYAFMSQLHLNLWKLIQATLSCKSDSNAGKAAFKHKETRIQL